MAGVPGYLHRIQMSSTDDDNGGGAGETRNLAFKVKSGLVVPTVETRFHDVKAEGGRSTSLPETVGVSVSIEGNYPFSGFAWADALSWFTWMGAHAGASAAPTQIAVTTVYKHEHKWPGTANVFKGSSTEVLGKLSTSDAGQNRLFRNAIVPEFHITGSRDNPIEFNGSMQLGGTVTSAGAGTGSLNIITARLFTFGMVSCHYHATAGFSGASPTHGWTAAHVMTTDSDLSTAATAVDLTPYLQSFDIFYNRRADIPRSKAPGLVDSNGAGIIPDSLDWLEDTNGPDATLELVFTSTATAEQSNIAGFPADKEAGTQRGFEIWIEENTATVVGAILGQKHTFGRVQIIETNEVERGGGIKDLRVLCRPIYDSTLVGGAHLSYTAQHNLTYGA